MNIQQLEEETKQLFIDARIKPPRRILPTIIFPEQTPEQCFKTRMRTLFRDIRLITSDVNGNNIIVKSEKGEKLYAHTRQRIINEQNMDIEVMTPWKTS